MCANSLFTVNRIANREHTCSVGPCWIHKYGLALERANGIMQS